jgi:hypothetical protein
MTGYNAFKKITHISDTFIEEAAFDHEIVPAVILKPKQGFWASIASFFGSAAGVAVICGVISIGMITGITMLGRGNSHNNPASTVGATITEGMITDTQNETDEQTTEPPSDSTTDENDIDSILATAEPYELYDKKPEDIISETAFITKYYESGWKEGIARMALIQSPTDEYTRYMYIDLIDFEGNIVAKDEIFNLPLYNVEGLFLYSPESNRFLQVGYRVLKEDNGYGAILGLHGGYIAYTWAPDELTGEYTLGRYDEQDGFYHSVSNMTETRFKKYQHNLIMMNSYATRALNQYSHITDWVIVCDFNQCYAPGEGPQFDPDTDYASYAEKLESYTPQMLLDIYKERYGEDEE